MAASRRALWAAPAGGGYTSPSLLVSDELVSRLLATGGHAEEMEQRIPAFVRACSTTRPAGPPSWTCPLCRMTLPRCATSSPTGPEKTSPLDAEVIIVTAYYDGLGARPRWRPLPRRQRQRQRYRYHAGDDPHPQTAGLSSQAHTSCSPPGSAESANARWITPATCGRIRTLPMPTPSSPAWHWRV